MADLSDSNGTSVRDNTLVELIGADGTVIGNTSDKLNTASTQAGTWNITNVTGTVSLPTGAATAANQSTEITSLQLLDDIPHSQNTALGKGVPLMGQLDDSSTTVATEENVAVARITAQRALHINFRNNSGTEIGTVSNPVSVTGSVTVSSTAETVNKTFYACAMNIAIGNNKSMLSLVNTSSSVVVKIREIYLVNAQNTAVTGVIADFKLFRCVSHSSGTDITPISYDTTDSLDSNSTVKTGATIGTEGTIPLKQVKWSSDEWGVGAQDVESQDHGYQALIPFYKQAPNCKPITLRQDEGITLKQTTNSTAGSFDIRVLFTQE